MRSRCSAHNPCRALAWSDFCAHMSVRDVENPPTVYVAGEETKLYRGEEIEIKPNSVLFNEVISLRKEVEDRVHPLIDGSIIVDEPAISFGSYYSPSTMLFTIGGKCWRTDPITKRYVQITGIRDEDGDLGPKGSPIVVEWDDAALSKIGLRVTLER